jgi:DNA repair photolyase
MGICAESVLCQPLILVYLTPESVETYLKQLAAAGVRNIKPEFLTAEVKNLALVAQFVNHHNPQLLRDFLYPYLREDNRAHLKQRLRRAPDRAACVEKLALIRQIAGNYGITISMCNWVEQELSRQAAWVSNVDAASHAGGWRCLGYQMRLFPSWRQQ